jgi:hypothetical protein
VLDVWESHVHDLELIFSIHWQNDLSGDNNYVQNQLCFA